jgi:putative ABC transport system permease protein
MNIIELLRTASGALFANKMRSSLTILGIIIGVAAVITLTSIGSGSQAAITSNIESLGSNLLFISPGATTSEGVRTAQGSAVSLTLADAEALNEASAVKGVAAYYQAMSQIIVGKINVRTMVYGVTPEYETVRNAPLSDGEFITAQHVTSRALVAILGSSVADTLFPDSDPIGQTVKIGGYPYKVIGVLKSKGGTGTGNSDDMVLAPITTVQYRLSMSRTVSGAQNVSSISVQVTNSKMIDTAIAEVTEILQLRHNITDPADNDFTITSQQDTIDSLKASSQVWVIFLGAIAGISLLVGGIGIMNIMMVSVTERTREIGIRKAVGAKRRDILLQFLVESALLSLVGGAIGVLIAFLLTHFMSTVNFGGQDIKMVLSSGITVLAVSVSVAIGIIFGLYPAYRAARLKPIEALHYE